MVDYQKRCKELEQEIHNRIQKHSKEIVGYKIRLEKANAAILEKEDIIKKLDGERVVIPAKQKPEIDLSIKLRQEIEAHAETRRRLEQMTITLDLVRSKENNRKSEIEILNETITKQDKTIQELEVKLAESQSKPVGTESAISIDLAEEKTAHQNTKVRLEKVFMELSLLKASKEKIQPVRNESDVYNDIDAESIRKAATEPLKKQIDSMQREIQQLRNDKGNLTTENIELERRAVRADDAIDKLTCQLTEFETENYPKRIEKLMTELKELRDKNDVCKKIIARQRFNIEELEAK